MSTLTRHFGIDFGTTNSAVVCYTKHFDNYEPVKDVGGMPTPSIVAIDKLTDRVSTGYEARQLLLDPAAVNTHLIVSSIKSALDQDSVWPTATKQWDSQMVASELFQGLRHRSLRHAGAELREAVVAIPVGMSPAKRRAIRSAATTAGIHISSFISESTAAFIFHRKELRHCRYVAVFDWGGGTLDISILESRGDYLFERYTDGLNRAGDQIDRQLAEWLHMQISKKYGLSVSFDHVEPTARRRLLVEAERAKIALQSQTAGSSHGIVLGDYLGVAFVEQQLPLDVLNSLVSPLVNEAIEKLVGSVEASGLALEEIGMLLVVGGSSKLVALHSALLSRWPSSNILFPEGAEWDIARGAAWLAANPGCYLTAESIGLQLADNGYHSVFPAATRLQDAHFVLHLGLVEDSRTANFLFATSSSVDGSPRVVGTMNTPSNGFKDEIIALDATITPDLVFEAKAFSKMRSESTLFAYDRLKWAYEMPQDK